MYTNKITSIKKIDLLSPYLFSFRKWRHLISNHVIYMKSIWFYLICFYPKKILEKFEENPIMFTVRKIIFFDTPVFGLSNIGDLKSCVRLCVRPSHFFSETAFHILSEILYEVRVQKVRKIFHALFCSFWPFWLKTVQN